MFNYGKYSMFKQFITAIFFILFPLISFAKISEPVLETYKLLIRSDDWKIVQLNTDKIYLINKNNHSGCEKLLNSDTPSYAWNINIRKYVKPVLKANIDIPQNIIDKLNFIILTKTPDNKNISAETFIKQQITNNAPYCEALNFSFI